jgi:hypothetical protein
MANDGMLLYKLRKAGITADTTDWIRLGMKFFENCEVGNSAFALLIVTLEEQGTVTLGCYRRYTGTIELIRVEEEEERCLLLKISANIL